MSMAWPEAHQSTSNHRANGESGPSRSTDHSALLRRAGVGTAMWLGTTSATAPRPRAWRRSTRASNASRPPASGLIREWSMTS